VPGAVEWITKFRQAGAILILWTVRSDGERYGDVLSQALKYCEENQLKFHFVNQSPEKWSDSNKAFANVYIDDAGFGCPLVENPKPNGRPYVDWEIVGPKVLSMIPPPPPRSPYDF
jgi:hypothetical protein